MSLKAMHASKQNSLESKPSNPEPVILPENLLKQAEEALKALKQEQVRREQAEQRANSEAEKNKTLQRLLTELCETSDSEMPTKLNERLKEQERQLSNEEEQNRQLKKQLKETAEIATADKKAYSEQISQLEADIAELQRKLKYEKFDKKAYMKELENREQELESGKKDLKRDRADFESQVQSRAEEIEKAVIDEARKEKDIAEQARLRLLEQQEAVEAERREWIQTAETERQEWLQSEKEKIDTEVSRQVAAHKAELDEQTEKERAEYAQEYDKKEKQLTSNWKANNAALIAKYATLSTITATVGLISGIVAIISGIIAFVHGLLPFLIEDGKEIGGWIRDDWYAIFGQVFVFPSSLLPILQLALPLIFLVIVGIWTALDFEERKWTVFANVISIIAIGTGLGISVVFGKQLSEYGANTVMFPIAIYLIYVLIRWLWEIEAIQGLFTGIKFLISKPIEWWKDLEPNQQMGYSIIVFTIVGVIMVLKQALFT